MKKIVCLLISLVLCLPLVGCDTTPLKEKLIVEGIAIDREGDRFMVTLQVYSPSTDNSGQGEFQLFSAPGKTVYEALRLVDENTGKHSYYSDTEVIVFSYDSLKNGVWDNLEYFIRSSEMSTNVCLAVTTGKAADLFQIEKQGTNMPAEVLSNALHYGKIEAEPFSGELMTVSSQLLTPNGDITIPVVELEEKDEKKYLYLNGVLCFQGETPVYFMSERHKWVYNWLHEYYDDRAFVVEFHGKNYAMQIRRVDRKVTASLQEGKPHFAIHITLECDVMETNSPQGILLSQMDEFQARLEQETQTLTLEALNTVFLQEGCDVFDMGRFLQKQQPAYFKALPNWREAMKNCTFSCTAKVIVARAGQGSVE